MMGPLWGTSTFPFENSNGLLVKLVTAAMGVPLQIADRCIMTLWLRIASRFVSLSGSPREKKKNHAGTCHCIKRCASTWGTIKMSALRPKCHRTVRSHLQNNPVLDALCSSADQRHASSQYPLLPCPQNVPQMC